MCISPIRIRHPTEQRFLDVPCGRCPECLAKRRQDWVFRNEIEFRNCSTALFVTLTYDEEHLPLAHTGYMSLRKRHLQLFFKRLRKRIQPYEIRYFACGEYGTKGGRPHYHILLYNFPMADFKVDECVNESWSMSSYGAVFGNVTGASINYVCKYTLKQSGKHYVHRGIEKPFMLCSRRPAIGSNISPLLLERGLDEGGFKSTNGYFVRLPRYYRERFYKQYGKFFGDDALSQLREINAEKGLADKRSREAASYEKLLYRFRKDDDAAMSACKAVVEHNLQLIRDFEYIVNKDKTF